MPFIPIPDVAYLKAGLKVGSLVGSIGLYFRKTGYVPNDVEELLDFAEDTFVTELMYPLCDDVKAYELTVQDMRTEEGQVWVRDIDIIGGSGTGENPLIFGAAVVVSFYGEGRGPWNRGRNYVPGMTEGTVDEADVQQAIADDLVLAYNKLLTPGAPGWAWVIASRHYKGAPRLVAVTTPVQRVRVRDLRLGFQRRRVPRR